MRQGKIVKIVGLLIIIFFLSACGEEKTELRIEGVVLDANDKSPIVDASVDLLKLEEFGELSRLLSRTQTDQQGDYHLTHVDKGFCGEVLFTLRAEAEGYKSQSIYSWNPSSDGSYVRCTEALQTINFQLEPE